MRWTIHLEGGPRRVNHAAVAIGNRIYTFGGFCSDEINRKEPLDVHVLNTKTYRWQKISSDDARKRKAAVLDVHNDPTKVLNSVSLQSVNFASTDQQQPSTSNSPQFYRRRSVDLHPFGHLRNFRPPVDDTESENEISMLQQRRRTATVVNGNVTNDAFNSNLSRMLLVRHDAQENVNQDNLLAMDFDAMDDGDLFLNDEEDEDMFSNIDEVVNEAFDEEEENDVNFIDEDNEGEDYDDFDFNYHNLGNIGGGAQGHRRRRLNSLLVPNNLLAYDGENRNGDQRMHRLLSEVPFQRYGHTVVAYHGKAYLWGGRSDDFGTSAILHEFNPATCKWSIVKCNGGTVPPSRDGHTAVVYDDNMYIFGGFEEQFHRFSQETYAFHFPTSTWHSLKTENEPPQHRDFHTACVLEGRMYIFGGRSDEAGQHHTSKDKYCNELKYLDLKRLHWIHVKKNGEIPCGRRSHSVWVYNDKMYTFGGYSSLGDFHFNDLREFDPKTNEWRLMKPSCGVESAPSARRRQCTIIVGNKVFLFGGTMPCQSKKSNRTLTDLSDLYVLDFQPSLSSLCAEALIRYGLNERYDHFLPCILRYFFCRIKLSEIWTFMEFMCCERKFATCTCPTPSVNRVNRASVVAMANKANVLSN